MWGNVVRRIDARNRASDDDLLSANYGLMTSVVAAVISPIVIGKRWRRDEHKTSNCQSSGAQVGG
jgi:hypothetical protein